MHRKQPLNLLDYIADGKGDYEYAVYLVDFERELTPTEFALALYPNTAIEDGVAVLSLTRTLSSGYQKYIAARLQKESIISISHIESIPKPDYNLNIKN